MPGRRGREHLTGTALAAARRFFECERVRPALLSSRPLPQGGLVLLRREIGAVAAGAVADWVRAGGVLWANYGLLEARPGLRDLLPAVRRVGEAVGGGPLRTGTPALDESLSQRAHLDPVQSFAFGPDAEVLLRAGDKPLVAAVPADRGWVLVEAATIERLDSFTNTGAFVEWVRLCARAYTQRVRRPRFVEAGSISRRERRLSREGTELTVATGAPILAENGLWTETDAAGRERDLVVIPNRQEGVLRYGGDGDLVTDAEEAIPDEGAAAWSWWLFLLLLAILAGEGALAAWAGRTYGT